MNEPHWTAYVTALSLPLVAAFGALIAYRQWRTAQNKLKLDLFERRMSVYQSARDMIGFIASRGKITPEEQFKYLAGIQTARWLFGPDVTEYLETELWHKVVNLELTQNMMSHAGGGDPDRSKYIKDNAETLKWLVNQYKVLDTKCATYMVLRH